MASTNSRTASPSSGLESDNRELLAALERLVRAYQFRDRQRVCYRGLSINECYALQAVIRDKGLTQNQLASSLHLDKSTTSRIVDSLEQREFLGRELDPCDGRAYRLRATDSGRRLHAQIEEDLRQRQLRLLEDVPADARKAVVLVLGRLADDAVERFQKKP